MIYVILNSILVVLEIICAYVFFETFARARKRGIINIINLLVASICAFAISILFSKNIILEIILIIITLTLIMYWRHKIKFMQSFVLSCLFHAMVVTVDYLAISVNKKFISSTAYEGEFFMAETMLALMLGKVFLLLLVFIIKRIFVKEEINLLVDSEWIRVFTFPVYTLACIIAMLHTFDSIDTEDQANLILIIAIGMFCMNLLVYALISDILKREVKLQRNRSILLQTKNQVAFYQTVATQFEYHKKRTHEYKNQLICMQGLLNQKDYDQAILYLEKISGDLAYHVDAINTSHAIVNAILNAKYEEALKHNILFVFQVNNLSKIHLKEQDIVVILSNLLDNAIEACVQCSEDKKIKLKVIDEGARIVIAVRNTYSTPVSYEKGKIVSSKVSTNGEHGIGLHNIKQTVKKYGGSYVVNHTDTEFNVSIVIPNKTYL